MSQMMRKRRRSSGLMAALALSSAALCLSCRNNVSDQPQPEAANTLECVRRALGSSVALNSVKSLRLISELRPSGDGTAPAPLPGKVELAFALPDRYKRTTVSQLKDEEGVRELVNVVGFSGSNLLSGAGTKIPTRISGDQSRPLQVARNEFSRLLFMLLVRDAPGAETTSTVERAAQGASAQLAIHVTSPRTSASTLFVDAQTCQPSAMTYERPATMADIRREEAAGSASSSMSRGSTVAPTGTRVVRIDLSDYRESAGIRFPFLWVTSIGGKPYYEEVVSRVDVNPEIEEGYFETGP